MRKPKRKKHASGIQSASGKAYKRGTTGAKLVQQAQVLARRLPLRKQGALRVAARPPEPNYLRHVSEYLARQRRETPLETSYRKEQPYYEYLDDYNWTRCERRRARREVLFATGNRTGKGGSVKKRAKPVKGLDCSKYRRKV